MKKRVTIYGNVGFFCIVIFLAVSSSIGHAQEEKLRLAVVDFTMSGQKVDGFDDLEAIVHQWLTTFLVETRAFEIVERQELEKVLQEQTLSQTGMLDEESAAQVGEILGVNILLTGKLIHIGETLEVAVRMIDATSGAIVGTASVVTEDIEELRSEVEELTDIIRMKLSIPRTLGDVKIHETFDEDELNDERWELEYYDDFPESDRKKTAITTQDGVLKISGTYQNDDENRVLWITPSLLGVYHSFEAKVRITDLKGNTAVCLGSGWYGEDEEENWTGICPYWEEDYSDVEVYIEEKGDEDSSTVVSGIRQDQWYTVRIDYINLEFLYYWEGTLLKRITPKTSIEEIWLDLTFSMDETRSATIWIDDMILR